MANNRWLLALAALGVGVTARRLLRRPRDLRGQTALITGSSRGLGLALALELARAGCNIIVCARHADELERARERVAAYGVPVLAIACDVTDREQVHNLVRQAEQRFERVDILVNNAGLIRVGPLATQTLEDFEDAMKLMFWAALYATWDVLPGMRARRHGCIVNITSIGGKLSVPHLLPYSAAKFAAVGLSEGLRAELARDGIQTLTAVPGLMRTGSHVRADFKGQHRLEYAWFSLAASLPMTSIAADDAARQIVAAIRRGDAEIILSWQASLAARVHGLFPGLTADALGIVNRLLPGPGGIGAQRATGLESETPISSSIFEALGRRAARDLNQL